MQERKFQTFEPKGVLDKEEGYHSRTARCSLLMVGKCPDSELRCALCPFAQNDQMILVNENSNMTNLKFVADSGKKFSLEITLESGTEIKLEHNKGEVMVSRKNT